MTTRLTTSQREDMTSRIGDVMFMQATLSNAGRETTNEEAYLAWAAYSKSMEAGWMIVETDKAGREAIVRAHETLVDSRRSQDHRRDELAELRNDNRKPNGRRETAGEIRAIMDLEKIGFSPDPNRSRSSDTVELMGHIAGRLNNVEYMANAIDEADGIPAANRAPAISGGRRQYEHLMTDRMTGMKNAAMCYNALRQAQREKDEAGLRTGLAMMVLADNGAIGYHDVLAAMGRDGHTMATRETTIDLAGSSRSGGLLARTAGLLPAPDRASLPKGPTQAALPAPGRPGAER